MAATGGISTKLKYRIVSLIILVSCVSLGIFITHVNRKLNKLEEIRRDLDRKINRVIDTERLIGEFRQEVPGVLERNRRSLTNNINRADEENNQTSTSVSKENTGTVVGAVYTRWGRTDCEATAELVYDELHVFHFPIKLVGLIQQGGLERNTSNNVTCTYGTVYRDPMNDFTFAIDVGIVGGGWYANDGSASNPLCLVREPKWNRYDDAASNNAWIYGTEYRAPLNHFTLENPSKFHAANMPCAVCRTATRSTAIMVPGRNDCFKGWTLEYQGYLMAGHYTHKMASEYICVDEAPEATEAGFRDELGQTFYIVEASCGSLPCPEYVHGREVTCAVCSK